MTKRKELPGPSCNMDEHGDPVREGFGARLSRDLEIEANLIGLDTLPPAKVRQAWKKREKRK